MHPFSLLSQPLLHVIVFVIRVIKVIQKSLVEHWLCLWLHVAHLGRWSIPTVPHQVLLNGLKAESWIKTNGQKMMYNLPSSLIPAKVGLIAVNQVLTDRLENET